MFSNLRRKVGRTLAGWTLRTRLIVALMAMLTAICLIIGIVSHLALSHVLWNQLDTQLDAAQDRSIGAYHGPLDDDGAGAPGPTSLRIPGQAAGTLRGRLIGGLVEQAGVLSGSGSVDALPLEDQSII